MKLSMEWLSQWVDLQGVTPQQLAEKLTLAGLEVEGIEQRGGLFSNVVLGNILAIEPHPNASKLNLVTVKIGESATQQVVCGAPNVRVNQWIAFAQDGAQVVDRKNGGLFTLGQAVIRGVTSCGMICSLEELGLEASYSQEESGIWDLGFLSPNAQALGTDLKTLLGLVPDTVLDTAPTANRGDWMSVQGIARDVAALLGRPLLQSKLQPKMDVPNASLPASYALSIPAESAENPPCAYFQVATLAHVTLGPSPTWLKNRLEACGVRSINNVVDITNYVMLELGQPMHAFDAHTLGNSGTLGVRLARKGEQLTTLDGVERLLVPDVSLLVTKDDVPVSLAGVMGGQSTEITEKTQTVILEAAVWHPKTLRKSAQSVGGLRTEAGARFERGACTPTGAQQAIWRAISLYEELCGASCIAFSADGPQQPSAVQPTLTLRLNRLNALAGCDVPPADVQRILSVLGFSVLEAPENQSAQHYTVHVPPWRQTDVSREIDLIEEVIRIWGYQNIPYTLPAQQALVPVSAGENQALSTLQRHLCAMGYHQVMLPSVVHERDTTDAWHALQTKPVQAAQQVRTQNSQSGYEWLMRQSLLPGLLQLSAQHPGQRFFELGRGYFATEGKQEKTSGVSETLLASWVYSHSEFSRFDTTKAVLHHLCTALKINPKKLEYHRIPAEYPTSDWFHPGRSALVQYQNTPVAILGQLHPQLALELGIKLTTTMCEITCLPFLAACNTQDIQLQALSPYPAIERDMAFSLDKTISYQDIERSLYKAFRAAMAKPEQQALLQSLNLFDDYQGPGLSEGHRSLAFRWLWQSADKTLTDAEVDGWMNEIKAQLAKRVTVQFR